MTTAIGFAVGTTRSRRSVARPLKRVLPYTLPGAPVGTLVAIMPSRKPSLLPTRVSPPLATSLSEVMQCTPMHWGWPTLQIGHKTGRHPKWSQKDGGRGSGSPLTRAFAGSKPPLIASLPASGHTALTLIFGDGWQTGAPSRNGQPECPSRINARYYTLLPWA